jgi:hypothetical protein
MKYLPLLFLLLAFACGKPTSQSESKADSLQRADSLAAANAAETISTQTADSEVVEGEAKSPQNAISFYAGEYALQSSSEAEDGSSLTLTYKSGSTFTISITKMVADFCSGTIESEISFDANNTAKFEGDGHPVTVKLVNGTVEVEDPERQLGVGTCEFNGTFISINAD